MPVNRNTLMRIRTIDECLRRRQRRWTIEDLRHACEDALYDYEGIPSVSLRTVQRDIELMRGDKLGYFAPIVVREKKFYEYEDPNFSITKLPLTKQDVEELSSAMDIIRQYSGFKGITGQEDILARMQDNLQYQTSHHQIVYIETNTRLKGLNYLAALYEHITKREPIIIDYKSFRNTRQSRFHLSPYLLKEFNSRWFLIAYSKKMKDIQTVALDRIVSVTADKGGQYIENTFFNPETYFQEMIGVTRNMDSKTELVTLRIDAYYAPYVITKPMHSSQQLIKEEEDGSITISLNVITNRELEGLILSFGCHVEVVAPRLLRHRIAQNVLISAGKYQTIPPTM
jgi:predicted DNA-binding transcriptional regulator YafY